MTFKHARWFTNTNGRAIDLLVVHSMELDEKPSTAEGCANYFATTTVKASAHTCLDVDSRVDCVLDKDVAYAAPGANHNGLHVELAGRARQTRDEWLDPYSKRMLQEQLAPWLAEKSKQYNIPLRYLDATALRRGERGVTTHRQVSLAFGKSDHSDPGEGFPLGVALTAAQRLLEPPTPQEDTVFRTIVKAVPAGTVAEFAGLDGQKHGVPADKVVGAVPAGRSDVWVEAALDGSAFVHADPATNVVVTFV